MQQVPPQQVPPQTGPPRHVPAPIESSRAAPGWVTPIGVVLLVLGSVGVFQHLMGSVGLLVGMDFFRRISSQDEALRAIFEAMSNVAPGLIASESLLVLAGIPLLVGAWGLIKQRRWAARVLLAWAGIRLVLAVVSTVVGMQFQRELVTAVREVDPNGAPFMMDMGLFASLPNVLFASVLPVFVMFWLLRPSIRREMATW